MVVNDAWHEKVVRSQFGIARCPSKHPGLFQFDLHVDDSEGVAMEGKLHGFRTIIVAPDDPCWTDQVLQAAADFLGEQSST